MKKETLILLLILGVIGNLFAFNNPTSPNIEKATVSNKIAYFDLLFFNDCIEDINFTAADSPIGAGTYRAADSLTTTGAVTVNGGDMVDFEAGTVIILRPGFSVQASGTGVFTASIEACTVVNNTPPTLSFITPTDGQMFVEGDNLNVEVSASDSDGTIAGVELFFDGISQGIQTGPFTWTISNLAGGTYDLRAVATDNDGATSEETITITVDSAAPNIPPTLSFITPTDGQIFLEGDNLNVQINASDSDGTVVAVEFFYDNISQGVEIGPFNWTINNLEEGTHKLVALATDDDGAMTQATINILVNPVDNGDPIVTISTPTDGQIFMEGDDLTVMASATDSDGTISNIRLLLNDATIRVIQSDQGTWDASTDPALSNLAVGLYTVQVAAVDNQGNIGDEIVTIEVIAAGTPMLSFVKPTDGQIFPNGANVEVEVDASDPNGAIRWVELFLDGVFVRRESVPPYEWGLSNQNDPLLANMSPGTYTLEAVATDNQNNTRSDSIVFIIAMNMGSGNASPSVSFVTPTNGQSFQEGTTLNVEATASDSDGSIVGVEFFYEGISQGTDNSAPYQWTVNNLAAGTRTLQVIATDNSGATSQETISITVNSGTGGSPVVSFVTPTDGQQFPAGSDVVVEVDATDPDGSIASVDLFLNGVFVRTEGIAPYEWGLPTQNDPLLANMSPGTYTLEAIATDNNGNMTSETITFVVTGVGNMPPMVSFTTPTDGQTFQEGTNLNIEASASDSDGTIAGVELFYEGVSQGTDNNAPYQWTVNNLVAGTRTLQVVATDNDGATAQETITITVSMAGSGDPIVTISTPADGANFPVGTDLTVMASATDSDGIKNIRLLLNGSTVRVIQGDSGTWSPANGDSELANLQAGSYEIKVAAVDDSGNNNVGETIHNITVGGTATNAIDGRSVDMAVAKSAWAIYPNPTQTHVSLDLSNFMDEVVQVILKDQTGRVLMRRELLSAHAAIEELDLSSSLGAGIYLLTIETSDSTSSKQLIVIK
ncbi:MAG: Ig-like domain-containing protein [Bacteroidota bacterium]